MDIAQGCPGFDTVMSWRLCFLRYNDATSIGVAVLSDRMAPRCCARFR